MDVINFLSLSDFLKGISKKNLQALAEICIPKTVVKKESLFLEEQEGHSIYFLVTGSIQLFKTTKDGREIVIKVINPGEIFAEVILFEKRYYPVSAKALRKSFVLMLPRFQIHCLLNTEAFRNDFIRILMKKQRYLTERILYLTAYDLEERFFRFLLEQYGQKDEYTINLSKKDVAAAIGTIPETLSRLLLRLTQEGKIVWKDKIIQLKKGLWEEKKLDGIM